MFLVKESMSMEVSVIEKKLEVNVEAHCKAWKTGVGKRGED